MSFSSILKCAGCRDPGRFPLQPCGRFPVETTNPAAPLVRKCMVRKLVLLCLALIPCAAPAQTPAAPKLGPRHFEVRRATSEVRIDGVLDEPAWADALTYDISYEWQPGDNVAPPVATEFLVTYDDRNLYAAWRCHDPRLAEIRANLMDRDSIDTFIQDDHVVLMIDPFNDARRG